MGQNRIAVPCRWWALILPAILGACATNGPIEGPYARTPEFSTVEATGQQARIELELDQDEIALFRAFLGQLSENERIALISVLDAMEEGVRGLAIAHYIVPDPENGMKFSALAAAMGKDYEAGFGKLMSDEFSRRWRDLSKAFDDNVDETALVYAIRLFTHDGICFYSQDELDSFETWPGVEPPPIGICDKSVNALDRAWNYPPPRMIRAIMAPEGAAPWQVQLRRAGKDQAYYRRPIQTRREYEKYGRRLANWERDHICGAAYIGGKFALTAAHCLEGWKGYDSEFFESRRIRTGTNDIAEGGEIIPITSVVIHASYRDGRAYRGYDIALIELERAPTGPATSRVRIPLHPRNGQLPGAILSQTGWGLTGATNNSTLARDLNGNLQRSSRYLRIGKLELFGNSSCNSNKAFKDRRVSLGFGQLCVGSDEGVDACKGDSGGPLVRMVEGKRPILIGIVSWGVGCGYENRPAIYTDVGSFYGWIKRAKKSVKRGKMVYLRHGVR